MMMMMMMLMISGGFSSVPMLGVCHYDHQLLQVAKVETQNENMKFKWRHKCGVDTHQESRSIQNLENKKMNYFCHRHFLQIWRTGDCCHAGLKHFITFSYKSSAFVQA